MTTQNIKNIKKLSLDSWMDSDGWGFQECVDSDHYTKIDPIVGKPGRYFLNGMEWFELPNGDTYQANDGSFQYSLELLEVQQFNIHQINALREVIKQNVATASQRKTVRRYDDFLQIRATGRNARKSLVRFRKKMALLKK